MARGPEPLAPVNVTHIIVLAVPLAASHYLLWSAMDREPQIRIWLAVSVLALLVGVMIGAGLSAPREEKAAAPSSAQMPAPPPPEPEAEAPPPILRRAELLGFAARAANNFAGGLPYSDEQKSLVGRRFELTTPIGCEGPTPTLSLDPAQVAVDAKAKTVILSAQPRDWTQTALIQPIVGREKVEAVEGFWIPRPWQTGEACPVLRPPSPDAPPPTLAPPSVGLAQVLGPEDSRLSQRSDRPFRLVRNARDEELQSREVSARFQIGGRLSALPGGEVVRCQSSSVDQWPVCLIGVQIDRVAFLDNAGQVLGEWSLPLGASSTSPARRPEQQAKP